MDRIVLAYRFPTVDDAEIAPYSLDQVLAVAEGVDRVTHDVDEETVTLLVDVHDRVDEVEPGLVALLDGWAASSGGHRA